MAWKHAHLTLAAWLAVFLPVNAAPAFAEGLDAGKWAASDHARVRLIPGPLAADGMRTIGVHIELESGWHTYWRHPGASGVPPRFDWSGSTNLAETETIWPAPKRLRDEYGVSFGYEDEIVFPIEIRIPDAGAETAIRLALDYAVCAEICIPEFAELELDLQPGAAPRDVYARLLAEFTEKVPTPQAVGAGDRIEFAGLGTRDGKPSIEIDAVLADGADGAELFVEGPEHLYFHIPDASETDESGRSRFSVKVSGAESPAALTGTRLRTTLVNRGGAVETWLTVE